MAKTYYPFDAGAGANVMEAQWSDMARYWLQSGVVMQGNLLDTSGGDLAVDTVNTTGMQVRVANGYAWIKGYFFHSDAFEYLSIATADATYSRIDLVVVQLDTINNVIDFKVKTGTPAPTPSAPALTQTSTVWEIPLAQVTVPANATSSSSFTITDTREMAVPGGAFPAVRIYRNSNYSAPNATLAGLPFTSVDYANVPRMYNSSVDVYKVFIPQDGFYFAGANIQWTANNAGTRILKIRKNGSAAIAQVQDAAVSGTTPLSQHVSTVVKLSKGDYLDVLVYQDSGGSLAVTYSSSDSFTPFFEVVMIGGVISG